MSDELRSEGSRSEGLRSEGLVSDGPAGDAGPDRIAALLDDLAVLALRHLTTPEISFTTASTLGRLARGGPLRLTRLAADEGVAQPSMSQLVGRLAGQGLVRRVRDPQDGRVVLVGITAAGRQLVERRRAARKGRLRELVAALPDEDRRALAQAARIATPAVHRLTERALNRSAH